MRKVKTIGTFLFLTLLMSFTQDNLSAQPAIPKPTGIIKSQDYPQNYFRNPLGITPQASGTFGELRSTHFHAGDDYRTQQKIGLPLYAVADGYVSRIRVQAAGGGHSLYINHPNGYTSVYLHMETFSGEMAKYVEKKQYENQSFEIDLELNPTQFPLKKGDVIGTAGNTGSSQGPHLHFEIRDTESQNPINTQLFGLHFKDNIPPLIQNLAIYDLLDEPFSDNTHKRIFRPTFAGSGKYKLNLSQPIKINGRTGLGIQSIDRHNGTSFSHGVYSIEVFLNEENISTVVFEKLDFNTSRAVHSYVDYPTYMERNIKFQKAFKDANHPTEIYRFLKGDGSFNLEEGETAWITYRVRDIHGNTSELAFQVKQDSTYFPDNEIIPGTKMFYFDQDNEFETEYVKVRVPKNALYDYLYFRYSMGEKPADGYSAIHHIHSPKVPLFSSYELRVKADSTLTTELHEKALLVNARGSSIGGYFEDGYVIAKSGAFGSFHIKVDTIAPVIRPINISPNKNMRGVKSLRVQISDNLSGIQSYEGRINGEWVLMKYDPKTRNLWHEFSPNLGSGNHVFELVVKDNKNNTKAYQVKFVR